MFRGWINIFCLAWTTAVLFAAPIVAALECRSCCQPALTPPAATCQHSATVLPCCAAHADPTITQTESAGSPLQCPTCPRCDARRPTPATAQIASLWKLPTDSVGVTLTSMVAISADPVVRCAAMRRNSQHSPPPTRIMHCSWQI